jgi:hypothetical protein
VRDIDTAIPLLRSKPTSIGARRLACRPINPDATEAILISANGGAARFVASRAAEERERRIAITYKSGEISINFIAKKVCRWPKLWPACQLCGADS